MIASFQVFGLLERNKIKYRDILNHPKFIKNISDKKSPLNIYIPVKGRLDFADPCFYYIEEARKHNNFMELKVVVIENDSEPHYQKICEKHNINYIFIPLIVSQSMNLFAKSLCYNIGFALNQEASWHIFHDLDILVDTDYFQKVQHYISKKPTWIQPYAGRRVMRLKEEITNCIKRKPDCFYKLSKIADKYPSMPGSPGGSIVIKKEDFINIGGYDPELFYGYAPEDAMLWTKLEILHGARGHIVTQFQGHAVYANDPSIEVYHMDHPATYNQNPLYMTMLDILNSFWTYSDTDKLNFINSKKSSLKEIL